MTVSDTKSIFKTFVCWQSELFFVLFAHQKSFFKDKKYFIEYIPKWIIVSNEMEMFQRSFDTKTK